MMKIIHLFLIFLFSFKIGLAQADSGGENSNVSAEQETQADSVFSDPEKLAWDLIEKAADFENFRKQDDWLIQLGNYFDFSYMARFVLGRPALRQINDAQLKEFIALFTENQVLSILPSLENIDSIKLKRKKTSKKNRTLLVFSYTGESNQPIEVGVHVKEVSEGLVKIYDLQIEGIRMLISWRSEFQSLIRSKGFEGMMEVLRNKLEKNRSR